MNSKDLKKGVIQGINSFANPMNTTVQLINTICSSQYTKETINNLIISPITSKCIPSMKFDGYMDVSRGLYALFFLEPDRFVEKVLIDNDVKNTKDQLNKRFLDDGMTYHIWNSTPVSTEKMISIIKHNGSVIYVMFENTDKTPPKLAVHFLGQSMMKSFKEYKDLLEEIKNVKEDMKDTKKHRKIEIVQFKDNGRANRRVQIVPKTIIVEHIQDEIDGIVEMVNRSEEIKENYGINKTTGVLLYGPHGSGKSTIAQYLAMILGRVLILTTAKNLTEAVDYVSRFGDREKFIMLIEDIDFMFTDRRTETKTKDNQESMEQTNMLFQVMNGVLSDSNLLVIATTNYKDRLDPALIRDGRFDFRLEILGLDMHDAEKVCEKFGVDPDEIKLSEWKTPISPNVLETFILKYLTSPNREKG